MSSIVPIKHKVYSMEYPYFKTPSGWSAINVRVLSAEPVASTAFREYFKAAYCIP